MDQARFIIIGLGNVGFPLVRMLPRDMSLVCIDVSAENLDEVRQIRGGAVTTIQGDATSRLVLEEVGITGTDTVVITTTTERINIEVARVLAEHFTVQRVISLGITQKGIAALQSHGAEVENIFSVSAIGLRNRLEQKTKTVHGIGIGKNEILEVEVHPFSRLINKSLASLRPVRWHAGIIYREGNIVIPTGQTVLKPRDRVVILGDPAALRTMSDILTFRFEAFPLEYGDTLYIYLDGEESDEFIGEACYLLNGLPLSHAVIIHTPSALSAIERITRQTAEHCSTTPSIEKTIYPPHLAVEQAMKNHVGRPGMVMLAHPGKGGGMLSFLRERSGKRLLLNLWKVANCPILLSRGTFPYESVAVPCIDNTSLQHALETTVELSTSLNSDITALLPLLSRYISTEEEMGELEQMRQTVSDLGLLLKKRITTLEFKGNPISSLSACLTDYHLMAMNIGSFRLLHFFRGIFRPDVAWHLVERSPVSTLLIPPTETAI